MVLDGDPSRVLGSSKWRLLVGLLAFLFVASSLFLNVVTVGWRVASSPQNGDRCPSIGELAAGLFYAAANVTAKLPAVDPAASRPAPKEAPRNWTEHSFVRAAVIYIPANNPAFIPQLRWFHRSWRESSNYEPKLWRTDIVVIAPAKLAVLEELDCTKEPRRRRDEVNACRFVDNYTPLQQRYPEFVNYGFADSIAALAIDTPLFDAYDWILRTDADTFLTPAFSTWRPDKMAVGMGGYCHTPMTCKKLHNIAKIMNLTDAGLDNVGSTWYGDAKTVRECAILTLKVMLYLHEWEFTALEKSAEFWTSAKNWPDWHYGVLSMYAGQIAINHCTSKQGLEKRPDMLDWPSSSSEPVDKHAHLHTWQDQLRFSKFVHAAGGYADVSLASLDITKVNDYATYMALEANMPKVAVGNKRSRRRVLKPW